MEEPTAYQSSQVNPQFPEEEQLNCPRCNSANTKFCYYNNYNLSQPRHICKSCKRYWTKGGTLRNIPVGGVTRKNNTKRSSNPKRTISTQYQSKPEQLTSALVQGTGFSFSSPKLMVKLNTTCSSTDAPAENPISSSESNMIRMEFGSRENTVEDSSCCEDGNRWLDLDLSFSTPGSVDKKVNYL